MIEQESTVVDQHQNSLLNIIRETRIGRAVTAFAAVGASMLPASEAFAQESSHESVRTAETVSLYSKLTPDMITAQLQNDSATIGSMLAGSIPGANTGFRQTTTAVASTVSRDVKANYACPAPSKDRVAVAFRSLTLLPDNMISAELCPSDKAIVFTPLNRNNPKYTSAIKKYKNDEFRTIPWQGDNYGWNVYQACPETPKNQAPNIRFSYKGDTAKVAFDSGAGSPYCDEVGQFSEEVSALVRRPGSKSYKQVGKSVLHVDGLPETLSSMYGFPAKYLRENVTLSALKNICTDKNKSHTQMRIKVVERFTPNHSQTFKHNTRGGSDRMNSGRATYLSAAKNVCN
jgi:hypothetical protein